MSDFSHRSAGSIQAAPTAWGAFRWLTLTFLSARRRYQIGAVLVLMLMGGLAELFTLGAVFPLLSILAGGGDQAQHSRMMDLMSDVGLNPMHWGLAMVAALFTAAAISAAAIRILLAWASQKLIFRIGYDLGVSLYDRMLHQPYSFHVSNNSSRVIAEVTNIQRLLTSMMLPLMQALSALVISLFIFAGLMIINFRVALISFTALASIYTAVTMWSRPRLRRNAGLIRESNKDRYQAVQEGLGGIRDVLLDNAQPLYVRKFARIDTKLRDAQAANALISVTPRFVIEAFGMVLIVALALVMSAEGVIQSSLPTLAVLALGAQRLMPLLQSVYSGWTNVVGNNAMLISVVELLQQPVPPRFEWRIDDDALKMRKHLKTVGLAFRYSPDSDYVFQDLNIVIPKGSRIGLVGKSGSGKSTLTDLLMGLLQPTDGTITVDGKPLDESNILSWQRQIAHVPQHIFLSDSSILENVAFGLPQKKIDHQRVREACRLAELDQFIEALPLGYATMVGERGVRLSGGQRQRVGLARALYKKASVLILDEATSALDDTTEASVINSVNRLGDSYTVVMIAHRVTTLRECDIIYRLENGSIERQGSYAELISAERRPLKRSSAAPRKPGETTAV